MICLPLDDICHIQRDYQQIVHEARVDAEFDQNTFSLGIFNGREYIYSEVDGKTIIGIVPIPKHLHDPVGVLPIDVLESDGIGD